MAKKKSNKKEDKKKDRKKKEDKKSILKLKRRKKKDRKKKDSKKKDSKKKDSKKKDSKKKDSKKKKQNSSAEIVPKAPPKIAIPAPAKAPVIKHVDHSSNYNVQDAVKKLGAIKSTEELLAFTNGEKRLTITKAIPAAKERLAK